MTKQRPADTVTESTCPACGKPSWYLRTVDRYIHCDGSENDGCWLAILRGDTPSGFSRTLAESTTVSDTNEWRSLVPGRNGSRRDQSAPASINPETGTMSLRNGLPSTNQDLSPDPS